MADPTPTRTTRIWTLPNILTLVRVILIPVFIMAALRHQHTAALVIFISAAATDMLDGYVARRFNLRSRLGAILDPAADKSMMVAGYVVYTIPGVAMLRLPEWLTFTVFVRDLLIVFFAYLLYTRIKIKRFPPSIAGKLSTFSQVLALAATIAANTALGAPLRPLLPWIHRLTLVMTMLSGADYVRKWDRVLKYES
jgi:cardiolipin synthase